MYLILEGDKAAVLKVEKEIKRQFNLKQPSFENHKESYKELFEQTEYGFGIIINHCLTKFIKNCKEDKFHEAELCLRKSKSNALFIICLDSEESPYMLTFNSRLEGDVYILNDNSYFQDQFEKDITEIIERFQNMEKINEI